MRTVVLAVLGVLLALSLMFGLAGRQLVTLNLLVASLSLLVAFEFTRRRRVDLAADWLLWTLTVSVGVLAATGYGLRDTALLAYPGLLVYAVMLWRDRTMLALLAGQMALVIGIGFTHEGLPDAGPGVAGPILILPIAAVLGLTAFASSHIAKDQRQYLQALATENARVTQALAQVEHSLRHDVLTQLPNRRSASEALQSLCAPATRRTLPGAVVLLNLDQFKSINESLGPQVGDDFLVALSTRLQQQRTEHEELFRIGSDEFLVILHRVDDPVMSTNRAYERARAWLDLVARPVNLSGVEISITASAGLALFPADGNSPKELLMHADTAMQRAKESGRNTVRRFDGQQGQEADHLSLLVDMREALRSGEFQLFYQPKFHLRSGKLCGAEALLRWHHPVRGSVPPSTFIPLAEKSGLITELGTWVIRTACQQLQHWQQAGLPACPVAVNVSMVQFRKGNLQDVVHEALGAAGLQGGLLELELTESLLSDSHAVVQATLEGVRRMGVSLAIDDFGTGYSNLGYLKQFEIQTLKIDQSFIRRLDARQADLAIVRAIVNIGSQLGLTTVAEGVETQEVADKLAALGCDVAQGYLWSPAVPAAEFARRFLHPAGDGSAEGRV